MNKFIKKLVSVILAIVLFVCSFSGCAGGIIEADAYNYLTKGEWFNYFVSETGLTYTTTEGVDIDESSNYYDSVMAIVDNEIIDADNAVKDLDDIVTKDVVAYTCVNYMTPAYRIKNDITFKDEDKITDVEAAKVAVGLGFVEAKSANKFGPDEYLSGDDCINAYDAMATHITTYEFTEEDNYTEFVYQDNVYDTGAEILDVLKYDVDIEDYTERKVDDETTVSLLGLKSDSSNVEFINTATEGEEIIVTISEKTYNSNKDVYQVGNIIKFQQYELLRDAGNGNKIYQDVAFIKITKKPEKTPAIKQTDGSMNVYIIKGVLPTDSETIKAVKENQKQTNKASKIKQLEGSGNTNIGPITITDNSIEFSYSGSLDQKIDYNNGRSDKTDPTLSGSVSTKIVISDIKLTTTGFDTIFTDILFGKPNATIGLSYKTTVDGELSIPQTRLAPYNNGNGKFPSNLSRSRFTTGNGAKDIKIGKFVFNFGPFVATLRLGLQINFDGTITINVTKDSNTTYTIKKSGISSVSTSKQSTELKAEVNIYIGVELQGDIALVGFPKTPIIDCRAGAGFDIMLSGSFYIVDEKEKFTDTTSTNLSGEELKETCKQKSEFRYCLGAKAQFKLYGEIAGSDCIVRKIVRLSNKNFSGWYRELKVAIGEYHFEDGKTVKACTRVAAVEDDKIEVTAGDKFDISTYNLITDKKEPLEFYITEIPCSAKNLDKINDGLKTWTSNKKICDVTYFSDSHKVVINPKSAGTCEVYISTPHGKYTMACSVTINGNKNTSFVMDDFYFNKVDGNYFYI